MYFHSEYSKNQHHRHHTQPPNHSVMLPTLAHPSRPDSRLIRPSRSVSRTKQKHEGQVTKNSKAKSKDRRTPLRLYTWREKEGYRRDAGKGQKKKSRKRKHGEGAPVQRAKRQWERSWDACSSAILQVVARDETWSAAVAADDFGLPPAVVLQTQDSEDVAFAE